MSTAQYWGRPIGHSWFPAKVGDVYRIRFHPTGEDATTTTGRVRWSRTYAGALAICEEMKQAESEAAWRAIYRRKGGEGANV